MNLSLTPKDLVPEFCTSENMLAFLDQARAGNVGGIGAALFAAAQRVVAEQLRVAFDVDLVGVLVGGLLKANEVRKAISNATTSCAIRFLEYAPTVEYKPVIVLAVDGALSVELAFMLKLTLQFHGAELYVSAGRARELRLGKVRCEGALGIAGHYFVSHPLLERDVRGALHFDPGISIVEHTA